ncbi:hypothetical protein [Parendozoicomonas sp. Alg238-R29]|uniref:hypothetical protein n=1 Tax=Parendozoicomonas sp. Alg238-R29 TaxID=2993446 RepID=UPI00248D9080|nr:hypothetical protein [Parendozoicomonas sp. Alg238-R29]
MTLTIREVAAAMELRAYNHSIEEVAGLLSVDVEDLRVDLRLAAREGFDAWELTQ